MANWIETTPAKYPIGVNVKFSTPIVKKTQLYIVPLNGHFWTVEAQDSNEARAIAYNIAQFHKV
jgi:hypothetical protein